MKKSMAQCITLIALSIILITFTFCTTTAASTVTSTSNDSVNLSNGNQIAEFDIHEINAQYIRMQYRGGRSSPSITVISSVNDLGDYGIIDISGRSVDTLRSYSADFFDNNFLIIVFVQESSGSIRHDVTGIDEHGIIAINRIIPEIGTSDMAAWSIIIERNRQFMLDEFNVQFINVQL